MEEIFEIRSCTEIFVNDIKMIFTHDPHNIAIPPSELQYQH